MHFDVGSGDKEANAKLARWMAAGDAPFQLVTTVTEGRASSGSGGSGGSSISASMSGSCAASASGSPART